MQHYQVVVNGNTYTVTVKSIVGNNATVDVDGWEFKVAISGDGAVTESRPVAAQPVAQVSAPVPEKPAPPKPAAASVPKKRTSAVDQLSAKKASIPEVSGKGVVQAHLPGQIVEFNVKVGDKVKKGDLVCKMEAMKMVNEVKATIDGKIKEIFVKLQQNVLENQPLMIIE